MIRYVNIYSWWKNFEFLNYTANVLGGIIHDSSIWNIWNMCMQIPIFTNEHSKYWLTSYINCTSEIIKKKFYSPLLHYVTNPQNAFIQYVWHIGNYFQNCGEYKAWIHWSLYVFYRHSLHIYMCIYVHINT